jgi:hypothetical protein
MVSGELRAVQARSGPMRARCGPSGSEQMACRRGRWSAQRRSACMAAGCSTGVEGRIGLDLALGLLGPELAWSDSVAAGAAPVLGVTVDGLKVSLAPAGLHLAATIVLVAALVAGGRNSRRNPSGGLGCPRRRRRLRASLSFSKASLRFLLSSHCWVLRVNALALAVCQSGRWRHSPSLPPWGKRLWRLKPALDVWTVPSH